MYHIGLVWTCQIRHTPSVWLRQAKLSNPIILGTTGRLELMYHISLKEQV